MASVDPTGTDWNDREIDLIVADYFDMLTLELLGQPYVKAHRNEAMQQLTGRSRGSIEFKHQNISAVLQELGTTWIVGYKPRANYQRALLDGIERLLDIQGVAFVVPASETRVQAVSAPIEIFFEPPPSLTPKEGGSDASPALRRLVGKFDPATRDAQNRDLGRRGEERILVAEKKRLIAVDRKDLARKVKWVSEIEGDGAGFDILSYTEKGEERLLEVKTTPGYQRTPFYLTENERLVSEERPEAFRLVRLYDFYREPRAFELAPPLAESVILKPTNYRASFA